MKRKKKLWIDIDGVLRDLHALIRGGEPKKWSAKIGKYTFNEYINNKLDILVDAPPTEYFPIICDYVKTMEKINIISCQPCKWIPYTIKWLDTNLNRQGINKYHLTIVSHIEQKEEYINRNELIIEDYPFFSKRMKKKIILIDKPYNQKSSNHLVRVYNTTELQDALIKYVG